MFYECKSLITLDISNFNISYNYYWWDIFYGCYSLKYINLYSYKGPDIFYSIPSSYIIYCIKNISNINNQLPSLTEKVSQNDCSRFGIIFNDNSSSSLHTDLYTDVSSLMSTNEMEKASDYSSEF